MFNPRPVRAPIELLRASIARHESMKGMSAAYGASPLQMQDVGLLG